MSTWDCVQSGRYINISLDESTIYCLPRLISRRNALMTALETGEIDAGDSEEMLHIEHILQHFEMANLLEELFCSDFLYIFPKAEENIKLSSNSNHSNSIEELELEQTEYSCSKRKRYSTIFSDLSFLFSCKEFPLDEKVNEYIQIASKFSFIEEEVSSLISLLSHCTSVDNSELLLAVLRLQTPLAIKFAMFILWNTRCDIKILINTLISAVLDSLKQKSIVDSWLLGRNLPYFESLTTFLEEKQLSGKARSEWNPQLLWSILTSSNAIRVLVQLSTLSFALAELILTQLWKRKSLPVLIIAISKQIRDNHKCLSFRHISCFLNESNSSTQSHSTTDKHLYSRCCECKEITSANKLFADPQTNSWFWKDIRKSLNRSNSSTSFARASISYSNPSNILLDLCTRGKVLTTIIELLEEQTSAFVDAIHCLHPDSLTETKSSLSNFSLSTNAPPASPSSLFQRTRGSSSSFSLLKSNSLNSNDSSEKTRIFSPTIAVARENAQSSAQKWDTNVLSSNKSLSPGLDACSSLISQISGEIKHHEHIESQSVDQDPDKCETPSLRTFGLKESSSLSNWFISNSNSHPTLHHQQVLELNYNSWVRLSQCYFGVFLTAEMCIFDSKNFAIRDELVISVVNASEKLVSSIHHVLRWCEKQLTKADTEFESKANKISKSFPSGNMPVIDLSQDIQSSQKKEKRKKPSRANVNLALNLGKIVNTVAHKHAALNLLWSVVGTVMLSGVAAEKTKDDSDEENTNIFLKFGEKSTTSAEVKLHAIVHKNSENSIKASPVFVPVSSPTFSPLPSPIYSPLKSPENNLNHVIRFIRVLRSLYEIKITRSFVQSLALRVHNCNAKAICSQFYQVVGYQSLLQDR